LSLIGLLVAASAGAAAEPTPVDEEAPWPRVRSTNGSTVTFHLPQVERWTTNWLSARAAVELKTTRPKKDLFGVIWFEAHGSVDKSNRLVTLDRMEITKGRFPGEPDNGSNALNIVREVLPSGARTVSLDYLVTALGFAQAVARQGPGGLQHTPPVIIWATNRTVLVLIDGEPALRPVEGSSLKRVVNTPALLVQDPATSKFYLSGQGRWFAADSLQGPWSLVQTPPAEVAALDSGKEKAAPLEPGEELPRIIVSTTPAELLMTSGLPEFKPVRKTKLQYAADTDSQLFFQSNGREVYLLLSGRWFKAESLKGPWTYVAPHDLPEDFSKIPPDSPQAAVLASMPDTPQADLALVANSVPTTATVNRKEAKIELSYDGEPEFKPIEGTKMKYAVNAQLPVILCGDNYYALDNGVWFISSNATGPWEVAAEVPEEIYTIPPSSPVYYATYARIYHADDDEVEAGYTPGYVGAYEDDGTVVYGTGYDYQPWCGNTYYGWGWTWGYSYIYVPWYSWWVWRPWWNERGGLRAALIENIYDRWQDRPGIIHHDEARSSAANARRAGTFSGYPALYGRFQGSTRPAALQPPANTLALNPYSRPKTAARAGEVPTGATLLSTVREAPGGGNDLYASPDGNVYRRKNDGWYRREAGGKWSFFAPTQGQIARDQAASARGAAASGAGAVYRPRAEANGGAGRAGGVGGRVPDSGERARAAQAADLERQYYARTLGQVRRQDFRASGGFSRPAGGFRR
jgi:hypothetical protein